MPTIKPISATASLTLKRNVHKGAMVVLDAAAGLTITLPAATGGGDEYPISVGTTVTSNADIIQVANGTDIMAGAIMVSTDIAGVTCPTTATSDTITMDGATKGGLKGSTLLFTDIASGVWLVSGGVISTGAEATPFSAAVS
jgi:hypothetical protein